MADGPTKAQLKEALDTAAKSYGVKVGVEPLTERGLAELAYRLLQKYEPELLDTPNAHPKKKGAPVLWTLELDLRLTDEINKERSRRKKAGSPADVRTICRALSKREPWKEICAQTKDPAEALRQRYQYGRVARKELEAWQKAEAAGDTELAKLLFDKFIEAWKSKTPRNYWAGVHAFETDEGEMIFVPFKHKKTEL